MEAASVIKKITNPYLIFFLGAPGSGKGTQASLMADTFHFPRIETSKLLEAAFKNAEPGEMITIDGQEYSIDEQEDRWKNGLICGDAFVVYLVRQRIEQLVEAEESIILDGFPRTIKQLELSLDFFIQKFGKEHLLVLYLDVQEEEAVKRNSFRRICELMRHPILHTKETEGLIQCPLDGSRLVKRILDDPEVIKVRFREFRNQTLPLVDYFSSKGIPIQNIEAGRSVAEVFQSLSILVNHAVLGK